MLCLILAVDTRQSPGELLKLGRPDRLPDQLHQDLWRQDPDRSGVAKVDSMWLRAARFKP